VPVRSDKSSPLSEVATFEVAPGTVPLPAPHGTAGVAWSPGHQRRSRTTRSIRGASILREREEHVRRCDDPSFSGTGQARARTARSLHSVTAGVLEEVWRTAHRQPRSDPPDCAEPGGGATGREVCFRSPDDQRPQLGMIYLDRGLYWERVTGIEPALSAGEPGCHGVAEGRPGAARPRGPSSAALDAYRSQLCGPLPTTPPRTVRASSSKRVTGRRLGQWVSLDGSRC
jgi:hypothetical protein